MLSPLPMRELAGPHDERLLSALSNSSTPCYIYDLDILRKRVEEIRAALLPVNAELYFATMANDRPTVLRTLSSLGLGACVNSIPHLELAVAAGFPIQRMQYTSTGISLEDMQHLQAHGIAVNLDSLSQLSEWFKAGGQEAGIRVNAFSLGGVGQEDRIGIEPHSVRAALEIANSAGGRIAGLHVYVGTNFQCPSEMRPTLRGFFELAADISGLDYVNVGGGIGVDYRHCGQGFDLEVFGAMLAEYSEEMRARCGHEVSVICEPGRAIVASCGVFATRVTDVKMLRGQRYAAVDGSIAIFPRPFHHPESPHRVRRLAATSEPCIEHVEPTTVVGRTTFSRDILAKTDLPIDLKKDDVLAIEDAGAYSQSMASRFLGQREPEIHFLGVGAQVCAAFEDTDGSAWAEAVTQATAV